MNFVEGESGKMGGVVVGIFASAEDLLLRREHADHGEDVAFDLHFFADGRVLAKELLRGIVSRARPRWRARCSSCSGEVAALRQVEIVDVVAASSDSPCRMVFCDLVASVLDGETALAAGGRAVLLRGIDRDNVRQHAHGLAILIGQLLAGQHLRGGPVSRRRESERPSTRWCPAT